MKSKLIFLTFLLTVMNSTIALSAPKNIVDEKFDKENQSIFSKGVLNVTVENDIFAGEDSGYTNGMRLSYTFPEDKMPRLVKEASDRILQFNRQGKKYVTAAIGQKMYTPNDITKTEFTPNDYLYAGWLYGSLGVISDTGKLYDSSTITIGMIGPAAQAEEVQTFVHKVKGVPKPKGWDNQLKNEPGINFGYERKWREFIAVNTDGLDFDAIPHAGINLGNIHTDATIGVTFRVGPNLPLDYGPTRIYPSTSGSDIFIPSKKISGYVFSIVEMNVIARNIFLDGNSFQSSPDLNKRTFVKNLQIGASLTYKDSRLSYTHVFLSQEFKGQHPGTKEFGALTFSQRF